MSKPWGASIGSWAAEAELAEAEEKLSLSTTTTTTTANPQSFPSLKEAINTKPKKKKMTLSEFNTYGSSSSSSSLSRSTRLTPDEMLQLPTGPKPRSSSDDFGGPRLGGGFSNYGGGGPRGSRGGFDDAPRRTRDFDVQVQQPSRADEVDNWAASKRPISDSGRTSARYGSLGGGSRADEVDNWNLGKKNVRSNTFGSGFRDSGLGSGSDWRRDRDRDSGSGGGEMGRPKLVLDPPKTNKPNPFGAARPREEVLEEKGLDWKKLDLELEAKRASSSGGSRPTSSHGSRPTSSQSNRSENVGLGGVEVVVKPRPKVNPFGDAKPREILLEEKGLDWKKIDLELEHRRIDRSETEEEKALKEEIENLRKKLEKESGDDVAQEDGGVQTSLRELIQVKEKDLETLIRELDDKVRFGQKAVERPGSGAGRRAPFLERPPSQSGSIDGARGAEFMDRPRSRGTGDIWTRPGEDRRGGFQGGRDRGFMNNRDFDRSRSRERW